MYITILLAALGIFLMFRMFAFLHKSLIVPKRIKIYLGYLLPVIEFFVWMGFLIWAVRFLYTAYDFVSLIIISVLVALMAAPAWFLFRDFIYGLIIRFQQKIEIGSAIEIENIKGIVIRTGLLGFDVKTNEVNIDNIPYNKIIGKIITRHGTNINLDSHLIKLCIKSSVDINELIPKLKTTLINAPWVVSSHEPIIKKVEKQAESFLIDVVVYTIDETHVQKIRDYVMKRFYGC
ncbi:MAG: mechanosensitive ion channel family protein [Lentimicrobium sp.]|nr:mechanosensitive ion channel family protein [Lentimicrobium sp.]